MSAIIHGFGNNEVTCYTPGAVVWFKLCKDSSMKVRYSAHSDPGLKREVNQDWYGFSKPVQGGHKGQLLVICDGMGAMPLVKLPVGSALKRFWISLGVRRKITRRCCWNRH